MTPNKRSYDAVRDVDEGVRNRSSSGRGYSHSMPSQPQRHTGYHAHPSRTASGSSQQNPLVIDDNEDEEEEDGSQEAPDATQGYNEVEISYTLYGEWNQKIVGCRFYSGYATYGEIVMVCCFITLIVCFASGCLRLCIAFATPFPDIPTTGIVALLEGFC